MNPASNSHGTTVPPADLATILHHISQRLDTLEHQQDTTRTLSSIADRLSNVPSQSRRLPEFKVTSVKPPAFSGDLRKKPAHEAQAIIDEYLHQSAEQARLYGFRGDEEDSRYENQWTYVDWVSTGLTGLALDKWRRISDDERHEMTWDEYRTWIQHAFSSPLTLDQAVETWDDLKQKGSAVSYSQQFNELVRAIQSCGVELSTILLCVKYRKGLKQSLREKEDLFDINFDLDKLQHEAERLDAI
ncbi:hypothetical protein HDU67_005642, partial [Dinochytrium kinnereticum]